MVMKLELLLIFTFFIMLNIVLEKTDAFAFGSMCGGGSGCGSSCGGVSSCGGGCGRKKRSV